jgi:2,4-dienoyl-CoA reductase
MDDNNNPIKAANFAENAKLFPAIKTPMLPKDTFKGKVAFITGGGTGLGKNMALTLSRLGAKVFITSRREEVLKKSAAEIKNATGNEVAYFPADVRSPEQIEKSLDNCVQMLGDLPSLIINNAAGNFISPTERLSPNAVKTVIDIVLLGTLNTTLTIGKRLIKENKGASFVSIITTYAEVGSGFVVPSACAKSGIVAMTRSLAVEWARYGMRFNGVSPGPIYTEVWLIYF